MTPAGVIFPQLEYEKNVIRTGAAGGLLVSGGQVAPVSRYGSRTRNNIQNNRAVDPALLNGLRPIKVTTFGAPPPGSAQQQLWSRTTLTKLETGQMTPQEDPITSGTNMSGENKD